MGHAQIVEQADAVAEQHRHDVDLELVEHTRGQGALRNARAVDEDILAAGRGLRLPHDLAQVAHIVDKRPVRGPVGRCVAAQDEDRHCIVMVSVPATGRLEGAAASNDSARRQRLAHHLSVDSCESADRRHGVIAAASEHPVVQHLAAIAEAIVEANVGSRDEAVEGHRHIEDGGGHG